MKRLICFILILCVMIPTIGTAAYATEKVTLDKDFEYRFDALKAMGFLNDGFSKENALEEVAREQALDAIVRLCSFDIDAVQSVTGSQYFSDVSADSPYFKSISYAAENGIVFGNDGKFEPQNPMTTLQAITFIMRASGYTAYAELNGGYPVGYQKAANISGLSYPEEKPLTGAEFISLLFGAMDVPVFEQKAYGGKDITFTTSDKTVMEHFHDLYKVKGQVTSDFVSSLTGEPNKDGICIGNDNYKIENDAYNSLFGYYVEAYCQKNNEDSRPVIRFMAQDPEYKVLTLKADEDIRFSNLQYTYGERGEKHAKIEVKHHLIVNGVKLTDYDEGAFVPENGYVTLIGKDGKYDTVIVNSFKNYFLQRMAIGTAESITLTEYNTLRRFEVELDKNDKFVEVYVDNEKVDMKPLSYTVKNEEHNTYTFVEIPEGSGCSIFADKYETLNGWTIPAKDAKVVRMFVNTPKLKGECVYFNDTHIKIGDTKYEVSKQNYLESLKAGDSGYFIQDYDGKVFARYNDEYIADTSYAYLIQAVLQKQGEELKIKLMTDNGKIKVYDIKDRIRLNGKAEKDFNKVMNELSASAKLLDPAFKISQPIKITLNEQGEIREIKTVSEEDTEDKIKISAKKQDFWARSDSGYMLYHSGTGIASYLPTEIMFEVPNTETFQEKDYRIFKSWPDYEKKNVDVFDVDSYRNPGLVVSYSQPNKSSFLCYMMVDEVVTAYDKEKERAVEEVVGYDGLAKVYFYSDETDMFKGIKQGDVIKVYGKGDEVESWDYTCKIDDVKNHDFSTDYGKQLSGLYEIYSQNGSNFTLQHDAFLEGYSGKRKSQIGFYWNDDLQSFRFGSVYYDGTKGEKTRVTAFRVNAGVPTVIQTVKNVGNENATKAYIIMENGMIKFVALYNGLKG